MLPAIKANSTRNTRDHLYSMNCRERGSHAQCVYPEQATSSVGPLRMKQEEETDRNNSRSSKKSGRNERRYEKEKS